MPPKKTKFVNINASDCDSPLLPGRQKCECQATKHALINNCLNCGRIVCKQEGSGPCFFCGEIVLDKIERPEVLAGNTKDAQKLLNKYSKLPKPKDLERQQEAQAQKERLLEYDRNSTKRTKVIDDQSDYFSAENPWLSEDERKTMKEKHEAYLDMKNKLKRKMKITIDFAGRRIIEESSDAPLLEDFNMLNISHGKKGSDRMVDDRSSSTTILQPEFVGELAKRGASAPVLWSNRIQDSELQEIVDSGHCLSILQPYASMIMEGIKIFEGRNWYTPIRGRLWICAGNKPPTEELLNTTQAIYKHIVGEIQFPTKFPLGCLLGYVDLIDCIPQEEYLKVYPKGEVSDPYVLVLANPQILPLSLPVQGKSKIFKLDTHIIQAAKKAVKNTAS